MARAAAGGGALPPARGRLGRADLHLHPATAAEHRNSRRNCTSSEGVTVNGGAVAATLLDAAGARALLLAARDQQPRVALPGRPQPRQVGSVS